MADDDRMIQHIIEIKSDIAAIKASQNTLIKAHAEQAELIRQNAEKISNLEALKNKLYGVAIFIATGVGASMSWIAGIFKGH